MENAKTQNLCGCGAFKQPQYEKCFTCSGKQIKAKKNFCRIHADKIPSCVYCIARWDMGAHQ